MNVVFVMVISQHVEIVLEHQMAQLIQTNVAIVLLNQIQHVFKIVLEYGMVQL